MLTILLLYLLRLSECQMPPVNYILLMDSQVECCNEESESFVNTAGVTVGRYNETTAFMNGIIAFLQEMDGDIMVEILLMREMSGKYEIMFSHVICDLCDEVTKGPDGDYHMYMKFFGIPEACPFLAGDYHIDDFVLDTEEFPLNSNTCGRYKAFLNVYMNPEKDCQTNGPVMFCLTMRLLIEGDEGL